jgi:MFS superfamily sulfate permease-like transporter
VSGPAAGLTTIVAASIISLGDYKLFLLAVIVAGLFQLILGLCKLGAIANYFPSSVIKGMLAAPFLLNRIPYASLSAILLVTGYNLTTPKLYRNMWSLWWKQFLPFTITIVMIFATDLLIGVCIGLLLSIYYIVRNNFKAEYKISENTENGIHSYLIKLNSNVTFLNKVNLRKALDHIPENSSLTIDGSECNFIDYDILEIISEFDSKAKDRNIKLNLKGVEKVNVMAVH